MKLKILYLFFMFSVSVFSQQKQIQLYWEGTEKIFFLNSEIQIPSFQKDNLYFNTDSGLQFIALWQDIKLVDENSVTVKNAVFSSISSEELKDLDLKLIPEQLQVSLKNAISPEQSYLQFKISPIIKDGNSFKKLMSCSVDYKYGNTALNTQLKRKAIYNSVLANGDWYRFAVDTSGVFRLSKSFLQDLGVNVNNINPQTIKIYGNGGAMMPYANSENQYFDMQENAIKVVGESDGVFNNDDYILFYGQGPQGYNANSNTNLNIYTNQTYYYINISAGNGKRINDVVQPTETATTVINTFQDYQYHEKDEVNLAMMGRRWFGDAFGVEDVKTFNFNFPNLKTSDPIIFKAYFGGANSSITAINVKANNVNIADLTLGEITRYVYANGAQTIKTINSNTDAVEVSVTFNNLGNPSANLYIDYISLEATRNLTFEGSQMPFKYNNASQLSGVAEYNIANASAITEVWDVTDVFNVQSISNTNSEANFSFKSNLGVEKKYVALSNTGYLVPKRANITQIANQNIKGTIFNDANGNFLDVDYIIVSPENFLSQANRLAEINKQQYGLNVKVLLLKDIYNEFSSGNPDIAAIRNMLKYVYDNASTPQKRLKYLCLFGDGSVDYKNRLPNNTNIIPSWHAYDSFGAASAIISDDFYAMLDNNEGTMATNNLMDLAVGRILAETPQRAKEMVDKIELYHSTKTLGDWRNNFIVVSDDVDEFWERRLQNTTDAIAEEVIANKPAINVSKIHSDAFKQESTSGGERYPKATEALVNAINKGALVVNYFGHGGEDGLASERLFFSQDAQEMNNVNKLNCFVTITCEYTRFDNPLRLTAGEITYWNKNTGAVSLITTTRQISVNTGVDINLSLSQYLFGFSNQFTNGNYPSVAEALRLTKNDPEVVNQPQKYLVFAIGDPALKLVLPNPEVKLIKVNDANVSTGLQSLKALSKAKLEGIVTDNTGNKLTNFNGVVTVTVFDKNIKRKTLANDGVKYNDGNLVILDFETLGAIVYRGQAKVTNGDFNVEFIVPKDITVAEGTGKVSFYAQQPNSNFDVAGASVGEVKIGGINENAPEDNIGPTITLYINDESFVSGGVTNESPTLLVKLNDENGINTASGIGHDITAVLDGDETNPFILNDYYTADVDTYQSGLVNFQFNDLEPGLHTLTIKAWDVYNNSSTQDIQFVVYNENEALVITNVLNYPNPFVDYTEFWFNHNSSGPLDVSVQIFTVSGKIVKTINTTVNSNLSSTSAISRDIIWNGKDDFGNKIGKGTYVYKLTVRSTLTNKTVEKIEKLVIL